MKKSDENAQRGRYKFSLNKAWLTLTFLGM